MSITPQPAPSAIQNPKARFGLDGNQLIDYGTGEYLPIRGTLKAPEGVWNLPKVAECIRNGWFIETALSPSGADFKDLQRQVLRIPALEKHIEQLDAELKEFRAKAKKGKKKPETDDEQPDLPPAA